MSSPVRTLRDLPSAVIAVFSVCTALATVIAVSGHGSIAAIVTTPTPPRSDGTSIERAQAATPIAARGDRQTSAVLDIGLPVSDPLIARIDGLLAGEQGVFGVLVQRPDGTVLYSRNANTPFVSASLYKLVLLVEIHRQVEDGKLDLDQPLLVLPEYYDSVDGTDAYFDPAFAGMETTVEEALFATGAFSSNVAAKALLAETSPAKLNKLAKALGMNNTQLFLHPRELPSWPPAATSDTSAKDAATAESFVLSYASDGKVNITTPADMARFFTLMLRGELVSPTVSVKVSEILQQQVIVDRLPVLLPPGAVFAHKTGNLDFVVHDAGVIYALDGPIVLVAMVEAADDHVRATEIVQRLALIAYGVLDVPAFTGTVIPESTPNPLPTVVPTAESAADDAIIDVGS